MYYYIIIENKFILFIIYHVIYIRIFKEIIAY